MASLKQTARLTGGFYLALAIFGMLGFLAVRPMLHDPADAAQTLANLTALPMLARISVALELGIVLSQALAAIWFFKLFRSAHAFSAGAIAVFGTVNAVAILMSAAAMFTAMSVSMDASLAPGGDAAATVQLMYVLSGACWTAGTVFFGLWLIPMGYAVLVSNWMPRILGWFLVVGGVGYTLSAFAIVLMPVGGDMADSILAIPATIGEFWMVGYLLIFGVRASAEAEQS